MGYIRDHVIVVVACYGDHLERAHAEARRTFEWVSPISPETINGSQSFFVPPDGSKEGWAESDSGDKRRDAFVGWLKAQAYEDGSSPLKWAEVIVSDDDYQLGVPRSYVDSWREGPYGKPSLSAS